VPPAEEEHVRARHPLQRHERRAHVRGLAVVDPLDAAVRAHRLHAVREGAERAERVGHARARRGRPVVRVGRPHGERRGERVGHVVVAEQRQVGARQQRRAVEHERVRRAVVVGAADASRSENVQRLPGSASSPTRAVQREHLGVVAVEHPARAACAFANRRALSP
jgi:hypothetical protein